METPKFLLADTSESDAVFVLHTEYPRFLLNLETDEVEWFDDLEEEDELESQVQALMEEAYDYFDKEIDSYDDDEEYGV